MSERVLVTVHSEPPPGAIPYLMELCALLLDADTEPIIHVRPVGDPSDGPVCFEWYVRSET